MESESPDRADDRPPESSRAVAEEIGEAQQALISAAREIEAADPGDLDAVVRAWKRAILADRDRRRPRRELARVLRAAGRWDNLVAALKQEELVACATIGERAQVLLEMAAIYRDYLGHAAMYLHSLTRVLELEPDNHTALTELAEHYQASESWSDLAQTLTRQATAAREVEVAVALHKRAALLWAERCDNQVAAIAALEAGQALAPDDVELDRELERAYQAAGEWDKLLALRRRSIAFLSDPQQQLDQTVALARLAADKVDRAEVSIAAWCEVLSLDAGHRDALTELAALYHRQDRWSDLAETWTAYLETASTMKERIRVLRQLAGLYADKLGQPERAIGVLTELLTLAPDHRQAWRALTDLYIAQGSWDEIESIYAGHGKLIELIRLLERQVETAADDDKIELWRRIGRLYRDGLGKRRRAAHAYQELLAANPDDRQARQALLPLYQELGEFDKLAELLEREHAVAAETADRLDLAQRLAGLHAGRLRDPHSALRWWLVALEIDPQAAAVRVEVERLARQTGSWEGLAAAYDRACATLAAADPVDRDTVISVLLAKARVEEHELDEPDRALDSYGQVLAVDPLCPEAVNAIGRIYWSAGRYADLLEVFEKKLEQVSEPEERRQLRFTIARIGEEKLADDRLAATSCAAILAECGPDFATLAMLDRIYERQGEWAALVDILEQQRQLENSDGELDPEGIARQVTTIGRLARIRSEHLGDSEGALADYRAVLALDPSNRAARGALEQYLDHPERQLGAARILRSLYLQDGEAARLVAVYEVLIAHAPDTSDRLELLCVLADLLERELGDPVAAFDALGRALVADPAAATILRRLEQMAEAGQRFAELAEVLRRALSQPLSLSLQVELRCRLGALYRERMAEPDRAIRTFSRVLDLAATNLTALAALEELYADAGQWHRVAELLDRRRQLLTSPGDLAEVDYHRARLCERELDEVDRAIDLYWQVLDQLPGHRPSLEAIERLLIEGVVVDTTARRQAFQRLAELAETGCADLGMALGWWCDALFEDPSFETAMTEIERLAAESGRWQDAASAYQQALGGCASAGATCRILCAMSRVEHQELRSPERAEAACYALLAIDPHHAAARARLAQIGRDAEQYQELSARAAAVTEPDESLGLELGALAARLSSDREPAIAGYRMALRANPRSRPALAALERIYREMGDTSSYVELLERALAVADEEAERIEICRKLSPGWEALGDRERAIEYCEEILLLDECATDTYHRLERYYREAERWQSLVDTYQRHLFADPASPEVTELLCRIATVFADQLGDRQRAAETYDEILAREPTEFPDDRELLSRLLERGEATRCYGPTLAIALRLAALEPDPARRGRHHHLAGIICRDHHRDPLEALDQFERALASHLAVEGPPNGRAVLGELEAIDAILTARRDWRALEAAYLGVVHRLSGPDNAMMASMLWQNLAVIYSNHLDDREAAARAFERGNRLATGLDE